MLIRVIADLKVPDGTVYQALGINFRQIATVILRVYISPHNDELVGLYEAIRNDAAAIIERELSLLWELGPVSEGAAVSRLLPRFGDLVYLFFMITPPEAIVARRRPGSEREVIP